MPSGLTALCLLLLPTGALGFGIISGESLSHLDITEQAILNVTAQVCLDLAQAEWDHVTPEILTVRAVAEACGASGSCKTFRQAIHFIKVRNVRVDFRYPLSYEFHFDSETFDEGRKIVAEGLLAIKASLNQENYKAARQKLGEILHPVQDYYSHTNWVEMGKTRPNSNLLRFGTIIGNIADKSRKTCRDCDGDDCRNNILEDILEEGILTSGYSAILRPPPEGKCLHGEIPGVTGIINLKGGINKDFLGSSHGHLHVEAAHLAIAATMEVLQDIRGAAGDEKFLEMVGISRGSSETLCLVIDTTKSMHDEIEEVKTIASDIISQVETEDKPSSYTVIPFNDPEIGPLKHTTDPADFKNIINSLHASGGGDQAELSLSGLQLALTSTHSNSEIFLFTDAPAKEVNLKSAVVALIEWTQTAVNFIITDPVMTSRRRRGVDEQARCISAADAQLYRDLAQVSGGLAVEVTASELPVVTSLIAESSSASQVILLHAARNHGKDTFHFLVDETVQNPTVYITGRSVSFMIKSPTGASQLSTEAISVDSLFISSELVGNFQTLRLQKQVGNWEITMVSTEPYSLKVVGQSPINFYFEFVQPVHDLSPQFDVLETRPIAGVCSSLLVCGSDSATSLAVTLVDVMGSELVTVEAVQHEDGCFLAKISEMPSVTFVLLVYGRDDSFASIGSTVVFQRQSSTSFTPSDVTIAEDSQRILVPGIPLSVPFTAKSTATWGNFIVKASNSKHFDLSFKSSLAICADGSASGTVTITAPLDAPSGTDVTLTIEVDAPGEGAANYVVMRFTILSTVTDFTEPQCELLSLQPGCFADCSSSEWEFSVQVTDGPDGTGVERIGIRRGHGTISTSQNPENKDSVLVSYTGSCCSPEVELLVVDRVGNVGSCVYTVWPSESFLSTGMPHLTYIVMSIAAIGMYLMTGLRS
ncbi:von Willebrand factor A domain-containing protein 7-like [Mugil cephalus]|uniref:von Willebrand factor A domain-containing protein 7-like n=1 Tax=Mugil cephalus TaxID=48193 RepID=UPI001FB72E3A|nr:von Willebrand factor A domain-containing protein 7-like [Mugil cephalus]